MRPPLNLSSLRRPPSPAKLAGKVSLRLPRPHLHPLRPASPLFCRETQALDLHPLSSSRLHRPTFPAKLSGNLLLSIPSIFFGHPRPFPPAISPKNPSPRSSPSFPLCRRSRRRNHNPTSAKYSPHSPLLFPLLRWPIRQQTRRKPPRPPLFFTFSGQPLRRATTSPPPKRFLPHPPPFPTNPVHNCRRVYRNPKTAVFLVAFSAILPISLSPNRWRKSSLRD